jgi:toxin ParE1/3/4
VRVLDEFAPEAVADFKAIYDYLTPRAGASVAQRHIAEIYKYCLGFETFPERGVRRPERQGLPTVGYRRLATIAFRVSDDKVTVIRLFCHGQKIEISA